jgi:hypothetical protein
MLAVMLKCFESPTAIPTRNAPKIHLIPRYSVNTAPSIHKQTATVTTPLVTAITRKFRTSAAFSLETIPLLLSLSFTPGSAINKLKKIYNSYSIYRIIITTCMHYS